MDRGRTKSDKATASLDRPFPASSDEELVERFRAGDERGVEELVARYGGLVYRLALRLTGDREAAEEITWDVMQIVPQKVSGFRGESALSNWIYRIATNAAYERLRTRPAPAVPLEDVLHQSQESTHLRQTFADWSAHCEDPAVEAELRTVVEAAIAKLPPEYRVALVLRDVEGLSSAKVADILGLSLPAVKSRVHRARLALWRRLTRHFARRTAQ